MNMIRLLAAVFLSLVIAGCGGTVTAPTSLARNPAAGVYFNRSSNPAVNAIILSDGRFYLPSISGSAPTGIAIGQGTASSNTFTGTYTYSGQLNLHSGSLNATYSSAGFNATLSEPGNSVTLNAYSLPSSVYDPNASPAMNGLYGRWIGTFINGCMVNLAISDHGTITAQPVSTASPCDCTFSGTFSPDPRGNFYDLELTSPIETCGLPSPGVAGIAIVAKTTLPDGATSPQIVMVTTSVATPTALIAFIDPNNHNPVP